MPPTAPAIFSTFLMNDIPRGTTHAKLARFMLSQSPNTSAPHDARSPQVAFGSAISDSRLDDELSVATLEFSATPSWLLNQDASCFPKHTGLGTIWRGADLHAKDADGRTEFIRAVMESQTGLGPLYAEMLAEFPATDINAQDDAGRTALHWACAAALPDMVTLCLSISALDTGLRDASGLTAFDLAMRSGDEFLPGLFYASLVETEQSSPQAALLRVLTLSSEETADRAVFPGEALFQPVGERNCPLVVALLARGVEMTTRDEDGDTALHVAAGQPGNADTATKPIDAGPDANAAGSEGSTPSITAARTSDAEMVQLLLRRKADIAIVDEDEMAALHWAAQRGEVEIARVLLAGGADISVRDGLGRTAGDLAEANRSIQVVELLIGQYQRGKTISVDSVEILEEVEVQAEEERMPELAMAAGSLEEFAVPHSFEAKEDLEELTVPHSFEAKQDSPIPHPPKVDCLVTNPDAGKDFLAAVMEGDSEKVRELLGQGVDTEYKDWWSRTALHHAVENGRREIITMLLTAGANPDAANYFGRRPLHEASSRGYSDITKTLLAAGADVDGIGPQGATPLNIAAQHGRTEVLKTLLGAGANIEATGEGDMRPLHYATVGGYTEAMKALLAAGADCEVPTKEGYRLIHYLAKHRKPEMMKELLAARANVEVANARGDRPLHCAALHGNTQAVKDLLAAGANVQATNKDNDTALHCAINDGNKETIQLLLAAGADVEAAGQYGNRPLHDAVSNDFSVLRRLGVLVNDGNSPRPRTGLESKPDVIAELLAAGADIEAENGSGDRPIHCATQLGKLDILREVLAARAQVNATTQRGIRPLQFAIRRDSIQHLQVLLAAGAETEIADEHGNTPLHWAVENGTADMVKVLLAARANTRSLNAQGETLVHIAIRNGRTVTLQVLLAAGADREIADKGGNKPLHWAVERGQVDMVEALLAARAKIDSLNGDGETSLHIAVRLGNHRIMQVLLAAGADTEIANQRGNKPLHLAAAENGRADMVKALLAGRANTESLNRDADTSLHIAVSLGHNQIAQLLLEAGASTKAQNSVGKSVYQVALGGGKAGMFATLRDRTDRTHRMRSDLLYRLKRNE